MDFLFTREGGGVYGLQRWFCRFCGQRSLLHSYPKNLNRASKSPWNSASFDTKFNTEKFMHSFPTGVTRAKKQGKIIQNTCKRAFCWRFFIVNTQTWSEINSIFELSTKNCSSSSDFYIQWSIWFQSEFWRKKTLYLKLKDGYCGYWRPSYHIY
jgi:hypothetical protein